MPVGLLEGAPPGRRESPRVLGEHLHGSYSAGRRPPHHLLGERAHEVVLPAPRRGHRLPQPEEPRRKAAAVGVAQPEAVGRELLSLVPPPDSESFDAQRHHRANSRGDGPACPAVPDHAPQRLAAVIDRVGVYGGNGDLHDLCRVGLLMQPADASVELGQGGGILPVLAALRALPEPSAAIPRPPAAPTACPWQPRGSPGGCCRARSCSPSPGWSARCTSRTARWRDEEPVVPYRVRPVRTFAASLAAMSKQDVTRSRCYRVASCPMVVAGSMGPPGRPRSLAGCCWLTGTSRSAPSRKTDSNRCCRRSRP